MRALHTANLVVRAVLELAALAAVAHWGYTVGSGVWAWLLAIVSPGALALVWGAFVSPKARVSLSPPARLAVEVCVFVAASLALVSAGEPVWGAVFLVVALVSGAIDRAGP